MYLKVRQISKIAYVERVANRHVIIFLIMLAIQDILIINSGFRSKLFL